MPKRFALSNISIEKRLPALIFFLLFIAIVSFAWISYLGVRSASLDRGNERIKALSEQFSSLLQTQMQFLKSATSKAASSENVKNILHNPGNGKYAAALEQSNDIEFRADTLTVSAVLLDKEKRLVYRAKEIIYSVNIDSLLMEAETAPDGCVVGKINVRNDTIYYAIASPIFEEKYITGYLVRWRLILASKDAMKQLSALLGDNAFMYIGNIDGSMWTDLISVAPKPNVTIKPGLLEYTNRHNILVKGSVTTIRGTPWIFLVEISKDAILRTPLKFLNSVILIGIIILLVGFLLTLIMSRNITRPLKDLNAAACDIADGNYTPIKNIDRGDELGKLASSFNIMVSKVRDSQLELENKVEERTSQLSAANEELEKLNARLTTLDQIKTNFFTNISHELRTPLALILGPADKLLSAENLSDRNKREIKVMQRNARALLKHVNNLLDLSKLEVGKLKINYRKIDLTSLIKRTSSYFGSLAESQNIEFRLDTPNTLMAEADPEKIERILMNLLSNAFKFTPKYGSVFCSVMQEDEKVHFQIKDSGSGIDSHLINSIFERFHPGRTGLNLNIGSTGLGLSIVKEFIDLHKGNIEVKNIESGGAVFDFFIPIHAPEGTELGFNSEIYSFIDDELNTELARRSIEINPYIESEVFVSRNEGVPSILIVEDNLEMNRFISESLSGEYNIFQAFNGEDGLKKAALHMPDLILTDVMMPKMSGDQMIERLKTNPDLSDIPVILLTAKADEQLKINLLNKGVQDYLNKPFTIEELKARVNNLLKLKLAKELLEIELKRKSGDIISLINELTHKKNLIEISLNEKNVLLRELHHRVKNNLQIISSLLNMQASMLHDPASLSAFKESQNRIRSMALIHERLYKYDNFAKIDFRDYVRSLVHDLFASYRLNEEKIIPVIEFEEAFISINKAVSLGLILNELITNSIKYAFKNREKGELSVTLKSIPDDKYLMVIKDDGEGLPKDFELSETESFGLLLVTTFVEQISGTIDIAHNNGTEISIVFPRMDDAFLPVKSSVSPQGVW